MALTNPGDHVPSVRIYERDTDALFLRVLRNRLDLPTLLAQLVTGKQLTSTTEVKGQVRHAVGTGSIDIVVRFRGGPVLLIENKIDAAYSITRDGHGQPQRYRRSVTAFREAGTEAFSVLLAPRAYLLSSRLADLFDARISYEELRDFVEDQDRVLLDMAILQAEAPYEPVVNAHASEFFAAIRELIIRRFPDLVMKHDPNDSGVRPDDSRTVYFDVPRTLRLYGGVPRPRMSLQCRDSGAPSASVKIMLGNGAAQADRLSAPQSLRDIGGYLRPAGRSLGIVVDTPRLDTQRPFEEQADDVTEALEAAVRLQGWWNENGETLQQWAKAFTRCR
ncbi:MAG TPA: hypothetical protein VGA59_13905 [Ramlibacter sp.]